MTDPFVRDERTSRTKYVRRIKGGWQVAFPSFTWATADRGDPVAAYQVAVKFRDAALETFTRTPGTPLARKPNKDNTSGHVGVCIRHYTRSGREQTVVLANLTHDEVPLRRSFSVTRSRSLDQAIELAVAQRMAWEREIADQMMLTGDWKKARKLRKTRQG